MDCVQNFKKTFAAMEIAGLLGERPWVLHQGLCLHSLMFKSPAYYLSGTGEQYSLRRSTRTAK